MTIKREPWHPAPYDKYDIASIQALVTGTASDTQQQRALKWIIESVCGTYDLPFRPGGQDGDRASCFASGRMFCGQQIVKATKLNLAKLPD